MANTLSELLESLPGVDGVGQVLNTSLQRSPSTRICAILPHLTFSGRCDASDKACHLEGGVSTRKKQTSLRKALAKEDGQHFVHQFIVQVGLTRLSPIRIARRNRFAKGGLVG